MKRLRLRSEDKRKDKKIKIKTENTFVCKVNVRDVIERCEYNSAISKHRHTAHSANVCVCVCVDFVIVAFTGG